MKLIAYRHRLLSAFALLALPVLTGADGRGCQGGGTIPIGGGHTGTGGGISYCQCAGERPPGITCSDHSVTQPTCVTHADDTCDWDLGACPGGDGGVTDDGGADGGVADAGCGCLGVNLRFGSNGGLVPQVITSSLAPCATYSHERQGDAPSGPVVSCTQELATCDAGTIGADAVVAALADPDVRAAIAAAPVVYGTDPRPVDGTVFRIEVGSAVIDVGEECPGGPACGTRTIPAGVRALADLLSRLDTQELARGQCKDVFNP